jgi:hypothetical protein
MKKFIFALVVTFNFPFFVFAANYNYKCFSYFWNGYEHESGTMDLTVNTKSATANSPEGGWGEMGGKRNTKYKPRGAVEYVKFGNSLIVEKVLLTGGKELKDGSMGGIARFEGQAEGGFYQYKFICKR